MTTSVELAYRHLHERLAAMAEASPDLPGEVRRNCSVADLLAESASGTAAYLNLVDGTGRLLAEEVGEPGAPGAYEIEQPAFLEVIVIHPEDGPRDERFDAMMAAFRDFFIAEDRTLGGLVGDMSVSRPPERFVLMGAAGAKAARIQIDMILSVPSVFG